MPNTQVLLVDAYRDGLELYSTALSIAGIGSTMVSSADEALDRVRTTRPKVLVTAMRLPGTDGPALIQRVRRASDPRDIFIVALTTNEPIDGDRARRAGCDLVLRVPCLPETLVGELQRALQRPRTGFSTRMRRAGSGVRDPGPNASKPAPERRTRIQTPGPGLL